MMADKEKYEKIIQALRQSKPEMTGYDIIEENVMKRIARSNETDRTGILDFLFGWIYIGWVRKSLITASFALLGFFIWQQHIIMNQINDLSSRLNENDRMMIYDRSASLEKRQKLLKLSREHSQGYYVSEEELTRLIDSINHLNIRYRTLIDMIDDDTLLKKKIEESIGKKLGSRIKL